MAGLSQWRSAVPAGDELVAAAPMSGDWHGPPVEGWPRIALGAVSGGASAMISNLVVIGQPSGAAGVVLAVVAVAIWAGLLGWVVLRSRRWRQAHPRPVGLAAALDRKRGPVLLVTRTVVMMSDMAMLTGLSGQVRPSGPAAPIPGLIGIDAEGERLVLRFEDGTQATLQQRSPTPGATARVAALAAPVLHQAATAQCDT